MSRSHHRLYDLLPKWIRFRDHYQGHPLEALMGALELPLEAIEEDIEALYRGWFIETCDLWKVPYISDLLGVRGLDHRSQLVARQRARVGNTIAYRRRKGTPAALARAAESATGWPCHVVEYRNVVASTPSLRNLRQDEGGSVNLRSASALDQLVGPFNTLEHTTSLRTGDPRRPVMTGVSESFNISTLALAFWRLESFPIRSRAARA